MLSVTYNLFILVFFSFHFFAVAFFAAVYDASFCVSLFMHRVVAISHLCTKRMGMKKVCLGFRHKNAFERKITDDQMNSYMFHVKFT